MTGPRKLPIVRVVKPFASRGVLSAGYKTRFFLTLPGQEEIEVSNWMTGAKMETDIHSVDSVQISGYCSLQIEYADEEDAE